MKRKTLRRAGAPWRLLAHEYVGRGQYGDPHDIEIPDTEFDELVVGQWIHIEQMDTGKWWMAVGGVTVLVKADADGKPTRVSVFGPGDYDAPVEGCSYELTWTDAIGEG